MTRLGRTASLALAFTLAGSALAACRGRDAEGGRAAGDSVAGGPDTNAVGTPATGAPGSPPSGVVPAGGATDTTRDTTGAGTKRP